MAARSPLTLADVIHFSWQGPSDPDFSPDGCRIVYADEGALWLVETTGGESQRLTAGVKPRWSPVADQIAFLRGQPAQVWIWEAGGKEYPVTDLATGLQSFAWSPDGLELEGVLVKPLEYRPGQRCPVIVDLHPGPVVGGMAGFHPEYHWLAAQGYMVFAPDFRGGQTYGWCPPPAEAEHDYEEYDFHDVMAGVDWLVSAGYADPERLGLHGFGYGARLINRIISRTQRFQAAVEVAGGVAPPEVEYGSFVSSPVVGNGILARELGGRPWEVPEVYRRLNPLTRLHHARTPTLILFGELDGPDAEMGANILYTWLYQSGVEVGCVKYLGEGHVIHKPEHREDCWRRTLAWFDHYLRR